ncbi:MAG: histidine phosphatase family protein [Acidimicrobiales bacterium]|nr:histidine phosphatase family protein [Acidimicrobiales bacterium]
MSGPYPTSLTLVRHAESAGNVANDAALEAGLPELDLASRDMDVPLSELGEAQATALGAWFAGRPSPPDVVWCSPYRRAVDTATLALAAAGLDVPIRLDERLREREFGVLDRLTKLGIEARFPEQAAARAFLGKFFHRPPGGESWADVAARVRSIVTDLRLDHAHEDVVVVTHQAVIMLFRYVLDGLDEAALLGLDDTIDIANTSVGTYEGDGSSLRLTKFNNTDHLPERATTDEPDRPVAPR